MKKILCLLLASLTLLLAGCGISDQEVMDSIPTLVIQAKSDIKKLPTFGYDWTVTGRWGNGTSVIADTAHPLEAQENLTTVTLSAGEEVSLHFSKLPDSVTVTYWSADETDRENSTQVETTFLDSSFHFTVPEFTGQMVILISGTWSSYDDVSGTVNYAFRTAA